MKLAIAVASLSLSIATPIFACPMDHEATRTAEKAKDAPAPEAKDSAKETAKADKAQPADKAKAAKPADKAKAAKPADKVSQR